MTLNERSLGSLRRKDGIADADHVTEKQTRVFLIEGDSSQLARLAAVLLRQGFDVKSLNADAVFKPSPAIHVPVGNVTCGKLVVDLEQRMAEWSGSPVPLTTGELDIVALLASHAGHCMNYRSVYDCLHYEGFQSGGGGKGFWVNVRSMIRRIRAKFRAIDGDFGEIENVPGFGYRWRKPS